MKKLFFSFLAIGLLFTSCKKDPVETGTVKLDITSKDLKYNEYFIITPQRSATGTVTNEVFAWTSTADSIASVKMSTGGVGEVLAKRVGEAYIHYKSKNYDLTCKVTVSPRSTLLNGIYYVKDVSKTDVQSKVSPVFTLNTTLSTPTILVYENLAAPTLKITKLVFEFTADGKLKSTNVILENTATVQQDAEFFLQERYLATNKAKGGISYYNAGVSFPDFAKNTMVGIFMSNSTLTGQELGLGVKYIDNSYLGL